MSAQSDISAQSDQMSAQSDQPAASPKPSLRTASRRWLAAPLVLALATGCEPDPVATDLDSWYYGLSAVLVENTSLAVKVQDFAASVMESRRSGKLSPEKVAEHYEDEILPLARTVAEHADDVRPQTEEFQVMHDGLAVVWSGRVDAYSAVVSGWEDANVDGITEAATKCEELRIAEAMWFEQTNPLLKERGYRFEQFPRSVPTRPSN
jgi:hypothetical protein